ncbi:MAG: class I SAM-dependent methyltransferase [Leptolyngbyaceae cyanobacterium]
MIAALLKDVSIDVRVLDFGCGDGVMGEAVLGAGGHVSCLDIDEMMIKSTQARLSGLNIDKSISQYSVVCGGVEQLSQYSENEFDLILALNVLAYMSPDEEKKFYSESRRILRPGGNLVITHSNELFDLFTFNKYTVSFFQRHFSDYECMDEIGSLLVHPDLPDRRPLPIRENPLSYKLSGAEKSCNPFE